MKAELRPGILSMKRGQERGTVCRSAPAQPSLRREHSTAQGLPTRCGSLIRAPVLRRFISAGQFQKEQASFHEPGPVGRDVPIPPLCFVDPSRAPGSTGTSGPTGGDRFKVPMRAQKQVEAFQESSQLKVQS